MTTSKKTTSDFLPHISDPLRQKIAVCYVQHEMRKLFPNIRDAVVWDAMDKQMERWHEMLSINNFWNGIHAISIGFRLKSLVPWITSLHVRWTEKDMPLEELWFGGKFGIIALLKGTPEAVSMVRKVLFESDNRELLQRAEKTLKGHALEASPRDHFPIFAVRKEGVLRVIDGNGRLLQAIVNKKNTIRAFVGEPTAEPPLYEHWVPTSLLVDLVFWYKQEIQTKRDTTDIVGRMIAELIRNSSAGRMEFMHRAIHRDNELHMHLLSAVGEILAKEGIELSTLK